MAARQGLGGQLGVLILVGCIAAVGAASLFGREGPPTLSQVTHLQLCRAIRGETQKSHDDMVMIAVLGTLCHCTEDPATFHLFSSARRGRPFSPCRLILDVVDLFTSVYVAIKHCDASTGGGGCRVSAELEYHHRLYQGITVRP